MDESEEKDYQPGVEVAGSSPTFDTFLAANKPLTKAPMRLKHNFKIFRKIYLMVLQSSRSGIISSNFHIIIPQILHFNLHKEFNKTFKTLNKYATFATIHKLLSL